MSSKPSNCKHVQFQPSRDFDYALSRFADGMADLPQQVEDELSAEVYRRAAILREARTGLQKANEERSLPVETPVVSTAFIFMA